MIKKKSVRRRRKRRLHYKNRKQAFYRRNAKNPNRKEKPKIKQSLDSGYVAFGILLALVLIIVILFFGTGCSVPQTITQSVTGDQAKDEINQLQKQ